MEESVKSFLQHLVVEKGFSRNTLEAYRNDLGQFEGFVRERCNGSTNSNIKSNGNEGNGNGPWPMVDLNLLNDYIADLRDRKGYRDTT
ncbi:MAG: site-specific integrase, partial [Chloroflexi bacterium]|nr:site-specific integrase [Chloroflexota bacterium]